MGRLMTMVMLACAASLGSPGLALAQQTDCTTDNDGDGYYTDANCTGLLDCDDADATVHPLATEVLCDGIDQDCYEGDVCGGCDQDRDGFESHTCGGDDCNDGDAAVNPDADDIEGNGLDEDCDGYDLCEVEWVQGGLGCSAAGGAAPGVALLMAGLLLAAGRRRWDV